MLINNKEITTVFFLTFPNLLYLQYFFRNLFCIF
jgi:hypothetical protein